MYFFGALFILTTLSIMILKKEKKNEDISDERLSLFQTYKTIFDLLKLKPIRLIALVLLTVKVFNSLIILFIYLYFSTFFMNFII